MNMVAWISVSAEAVGVTAHQIRLWLYKGLIPMPARKVFGRRVIRVDAKPLTSLPGNLVLKNGRRI